MLLWGKSAIIKLRLRRSISIIIPAYNEEKRLPATLETVRRYLDAADWEFAEIVVVDDGSARRHRRDGGARGAGVRVLRESRQSRQGLLASGTACSKPRAIGSLFTDADLSAPIEELEKLWTRRRSASGAQVAIGSRAWTARWSACTSPCSARRAGRFFNLVMRLVTGLPFQRYAVRLQAVRPGGRARVFSRQQLEGFGFDVEVLFIATRLGLSRRWKCRCDGTTWRAPR